MHTSTTLFPDTSAYLELAEGLP